MSDKIYVVMERGFEYNDSTYDERGMEGPVKGYSTREEAAEACMALEIIRWKSENPHAYLDQTGNMSIWSEEESIRIHDLIGMNYQVVKDSRPHDSPYFDLPDDKIRILIDKARRANRWRELGFYTIMEVRL